MGGHLPIRKKYLDPVVATCPPSECCTIYPVPTLLKPDICETVIDTLWMNFMIFALPLCTFANDYTVLIIVLFDFDFDYGLYFYNL